jgi:hypothetical protein
MHVVHDLFRVCAQFFGDLFVLGLEIAGVNQPVDTSAVVPAFWEAVKSADVMSSRRFSAVETMPAFCRSAKGNEVDARKTPSIDCLSAFCRAFLEASTAMVNASSSQLHMERSPWATMTMAGANQPMAW